MSLPALLIFSGDWGAYLDKIYEQYVQDIVKNPKVLRGKPVRARYAPATQDKGFSFWHVISEGNSEDDRIPDPRRCERVAWIGWVLQQADAASPRIKTLLTSRTLRRGTSERLLLWLEEADYVVILEERDQYFLLVTAYPVSGRRAEKLKSEWKESQK